MAASRWLCMIGVGLSLHGAACVHVSASVETARSGRATESHLDVPFTVVVWNVHKERDALERELAEVAARPDLALLQEAIGPDIGPLTAQGQATQAVSFRFVRGGGMTGVATWSRGPAQDLSPRRTESRDLYGTPKSALLSTHPLAGGQRLLAVNVHGINLRRADLLARQLRSVEAAVAEHVGPVVVAGDFNTWSRRRFAVVEAFSRRLGLMRVFTGPDAPKLDAVFVRGLEVEHARVVETRHSDHDALVVVLRVPGADQSSI